MWRCPVHSRAMLAIFLAALSAAVASDASEAYSAESCGGQMLLQRQKRDVGIRSVSEARGPSLYLDAGYMDMPQEADGYSRLLANMSIPELLFDGSVAAYNPSLIILPPRLAESLHPDAYYLASFRHGANQCRNFREVNKRRSRLPLTIAVLDRNFTTLSSTQPERFDDEIQDVRLFRRRGGKLAMSYATKDDDADPDVENNFEWCFREFEISPKSAGTPGSFKMSLASNRTCLNGEKNLGLMEKENSELEILVWPGSEQMDVRSLSPEGPSAAPLNFSQLLSSVTGKPFHNNVNPVALPGLGAYLTVVHDKKYIAEVKHGGAMLNYFVLFDIDPPYRLQHISPGFCFPALDGSTTCEIIQFVAGLVVADGEAVLSYGVNDCDAAVVRMPLAGVLSFATSNS
eukprot:gb/GFBE01027239.1/.p1 GENE.gb/GFBE01027239.1/~~gb/GFBE01027239.1/.p1  ORF type:complete len:402 (+),score=69.40 gb/GFBE01027239.1/:1-1206(+)